MAEKFTTRRDFLKLSGVGLSAAILPKPFMLPNYISVDPSTFEQALAVAQKGDTLLLTDGIYLITVPVLEVRCNVIANTGARPILVRSNGYTPSFVCHDDTMVSGVWLGGARDNATERGVIQFKKRVVFQNNVIWNYYGGANEGSGTGTVLRRNVFVSCGTGTQYHPLYINNSNPLHTAFVLENMFIGGQAWQIHLWHGPTNTFINGNFSADADFCLAFQGSNNICSNNVWWKPTSPVGWRPINIANSGPTANNTYKRNFHGPIGTAAPLRGHPDYFGAYNFDGYGVTLINNHYFPQTQEADKNPIIVPVGSEATYLGKTAAEIDGAVSALKTAFAQAIQQVHDDAGISGHVATLQAVITKWAGW